MSHIVPEREPRGKAFLLGIFIFSWLMIFVLVYYGSSAVYYGPNGVYRPLAQLVISSTIISAVITCFCSITGGETRSPEKLTGGIIWDHT